MKILITGGTGLVGQYLQKQIDGIYLSSKDYNLTSELDTIKMFSKHQPDVIIHLAARVGGIMDNITNPFEYYEDNVAMNTNIVKYARFFKVKKFVGALSSCIYPDVSDHYPLLESDLHKDLPNENNFGYGYAKRLLGVHIDISKKNGHNYSYIIPSNLYGEFEHGDTSRKHFVGALLDKILKAKQNGDSKITLFGDGTPLRQFTFAKDIAEIIKFIITYDIKENMNLSTNENLSIDTLARLALKATDSEYLDIEYDKTKPNGQYRKDINCDTFKNLFPEYKFTSYIDGIKKTYDSIKLKHG
jgi:GDP-L-fucose synthase